jgi:hypothetical protein
MKIIKPGRPQQGWATETSCTGSGNGGGGCNAVLLVDESDLFTTHRGGYGGDGPETFVTFRCAACGVLTDIQGFPTGRVANLPDQNSFDKKPDPDGVL